MGTPATRAKAKYNAKTYRNFAANVKPDLFERIDSYCKDHQLSKSQFLEKAIKELEEEH